MAGGHDILRALAGARALSTRTKLRSTAAAPAASRPRGRRPAARTSTASPRLPRTAAASTPIDSPDRIQGPRGADLRLAKQLSGRAGSAGDTRRADELANKAARLLDVGGAVEGSRETLARRQDAVMRIVRTTPVERLDSLSCNRLLERMFDLGRPMLACVLYDELRARGVVVSPHGYAAIFTGLLQAPDAALTTSVLDKARGIFGDWTAKFLQADPSTLQSFAPLVAIVTNAYLSLLARLDARAELFARFHELPRDGPGRPDVVAHTILLRFLAMHPDGGVDATLRLWNALVRRDAARIDARAVTAVLDALEPVAGAGTDAALTIAAEAFALPAARSSAASMTFAPVRPLELDGRALESVIKLAVRCGDAELLRAWIRAIDGRKTVNSDPAALHAVFRSFLAEGQAKSAQALITELETCKSPALRPALPAVTYALQACHAAGDLDRAFALFDTLVQRFEPDAKAICVVLQAIAARRPSKGSSAELERGLQIAQRWGYIPWRGSESLEDEVRFFGPRSDGQGMDPEARHQSFWRPKLARAIDVLLARRGEQPTSPLRAPIRIYFAELKARIGHAGIGLDSGGMRPVRTDVKQSGENARARRRARRLAELAERDAALARLAGGPTSAGAAASGPGVITA